MEAAMFHRSLLALSLALLIASPAYADTIFITPALAPPNDGQLQCRVVNGSTTKTIEFVLPFFDSSGNVVFNPSGFVSTLGPLESTLFSTFDDLARYGIVTLLSESKTKVRVSISTADSSGTTLAALEGRP
jgi:hypothetical protein